MPPLAALAIPYSCLYFYPNIGEKINSETTFLCFGKCARKRKKNITKVDKVRRLFRRVKMAFYPIMRNLKMEKCILSCSYPVDLTEDCANMLCKYENRYIQRVAKMLVARGNFSLQRGKFKSFRK